MRSTSIGGVKWDKPDIRVYTPIEVYVKHICVSVHLIRCTHMMAKWKREVSTTDVYWKAVVTNTG